ncbi:transcription initiation factor TFIID subunit TAF12 [Encephalitozoon intestinalis ATCC 50506]|uniref:Transcription initiation factor TFIID subunit TAF12 n=1 Tax=Encephalitozoon intestinalis (strain ATCC 50506) TaxID=876142 RepID=E0S9M8_ENCIT|nr:transcription initiation factor TFIID subunit TAF12 [Encephalitozoon intestinalis ATCC 50506]ADM12413.1 transcription initiation factor TFIID subunit TAF12 [Encephalitozoon intestinalis ATCC 50506]UTX46247.1 transcription initiation factor TFIID subunit TAF12 [Encephalitozoon intestinalis]
MNFFKEGERLKAIFDDLVKQHKKSKRKVVDNKNVSKEMLQTYEENRMKLMHFFEMHSRFIRPRKNSIGIFSVDDFVKVKTSESMMFPKKEDFRREGRPGMPFSVGRPMQWGGMNGREPFYIQDRIPTQGWKGCGRDGKPMWMGFGGYPGAPGQESILRGWGPMNFLHQNSRGFFGAGSYEMEGGSFEGEHGSYGYGIRMAPGPGVRRRFDIGGGGPSDGYGMFPKRRPPDMDSKTAEVSKMGFPHEREEIGRNGVPPSMSWTGSRRPYIPTERREEMIRPPFYYPILGGYGYPVHGNGTFPGVPVEETFATACSIYPETSRKEQHFVKYPQSFPGSDVIDWMPEKKSSKTKTPKETKVPTSPKENESSISGKEDPWRLDITTDLEKRKLCDEDQGRDENKEKASFADFPDGKNNSHGELSTNHGKDLNIMTIEDLIGDKTIDKDAKEFIYELCDGFVDHIIHMSCALAYHRKKNTVEVCDVKLALKTEVGIELPSDGDSEEESSLSPGREVKVVRNEEKQPRMAKKD